MSPPAVYAEVGDTAAAAPLLGGIGALDAAGAVAIVGAGAAGRTGVIITADAPVPGAATVADALSGGRPATYAEVLRARGQLTPAGEMIPMGVPPESALFARGAEEMLQLLGGRCTDCGTINTPPSIHPACIACGGTKLEPVPLARGAWCTRSSSTRRCRRRSSPRCRSRSSTSKTAPASCCRSSATAQGLEIGTEVELVLRRYAHERGVPVYGWKARALPEAITTEDAS